MRPLRVLCVLVAATATADSWVWDGDDCPVAAPIAPATPEIVERTHRQQPEATLVDRTEGESAATLRSSARPLAILRPGARHAIRLPLRQQRSIARQHVRTSTDSPRGAR